ncbi:MAG: hypothetical protein RH917_12205 [Lacipirellulaceae bacterium]
MDREELLKLLQTGPIRILMNDGNSYSVEQPSEAIVSDDAAHVLYRDTKGQVRVMILPLVSMSGIEQLSSA